MCMVQAMKTIKENRLFKRLYYKGKKVVGKQLVLYYLPTKEESLIGYTVRKKIGKATVRNKVRRRIKESFRGYEKVLLRTVTLLLLQEPQPKMQTLNRLTIALKNFF